MLAVIFPYFCDRWRRQADDRRLGRGSRAANFVGLTLAAARFAEAFSIFTIQ
jgi:hypothetical protein